MKPSGGEGVLENNMAKKKNDRSGLKVIAYVRVSTEQQADMGNSLEAQAAKLDAYAKVHELCILRTEVDAGVSAKSLERPALQAALAALESGEADGILVVKLDRLTRSVRDLCDLVDTYFQDKHLMSVSESVDTSTASGRLVLNILATVSQWEREAAAERTAAVMAHMKVMGKFTGGWPPFGFFADEDGNLQENTAEQAIVASVRALKAEGRSIRSIARTVINPRTGMPFAPTQIARML